MHQVEAAEAQRDGALEASEEHAHEADAGEVVDGAHLVFPLLQGDAVLIPAHGERVAVAQLGVVVAVIHDVRVVALHAPVVVLQLPVADGYAVLVVALILVQRVVLVDVLHVGAALVAGVVALRLVVTAGRVALRVVDEAVAVDDAAPLVVVVAATEVVVVVAGGVLLPRLQQRVVLHYAANLREPVGIGSELPLLVVGETIQTHVLTLAAALTVASCQKELEITLVALICTSIRPRLEIASSCIFNFGKDKLQISRFR